MQRPLAQLSDEDVSWCQHCRASWRRLPRRRPTTSQVVAAVRFFLRPVVADVLRVAAAAWCLRLLAEWGALRLAVRALSHVAGFVAWACAVAVYLPCVALQLLCLAECVLEELLQLGLCAVSPLFRSGRDPWFPAVALPLLALAVAVALVFRSAAADANSVRYLAISRELQNEDAGRRWLHAAGHDYRYVLPHYYPEGRPCRPVSPYLTNKVA